MRGGTLIGYDRRKAERYFVSLESEEATLSQELEMREQTYRLKEAELLYEINRVKKKIAEINQLETSLKQWIQRNEN
ncbi:MULTISPECIES: hypothetical protein [unclassified Paenibacillus]|uniref:hypothetical protein n=1 Tax=unclassified Paenibacillus TaxID=185978 RepID=UPI00363ED5D2